MVTGGDARTVRYCSGPDGEAIPRVKRLLGQGWCWQEFSAHNRGETTPLWNALMSQPVAAPTDER
ncbi:hypothetical protein [Streptomyces sp. NPDC002537]